MVPYGWVGICAAVFTAFALVGPNALAEEVEITSLQELAHYAGQSGNTVTLQPGEYALTDYLPVEAMRGRGERRRRGRDLAYINFSGSDNRFVMTGVTIELDTELRSALRPPLHTNEFVVTGDNNELTGLTLNCVGDGTSPGGALLEIAGDGNTLEGCTFRVQGSYPYGYGDLFGKGPQRTIRHRKHSGVRLVGSNTRVLGCELYMRSFGHGFFIQGGENHTFENCYVEGQMRSTDDMLAETSGPAFEIDFRTVGRNRQGEHRVTPGYMKSLSEDGFRTYGQIEGVTLINCTAKNMRGGFELRTDGGVRLENCTAVGNERGFWIAGGASVTGCLGDAQYGPLLFLEGSDSVVELELLPAESEMTVHALATIRGDRHRVSISPAPEQASRTRPIPILVGYCAPSAGEGMSPYSQRPARDLTLFNESMMPIVLGPQSRGGSVVTLGPIRENRGDEIEVRPLGRE